MTVPRVFNIPMVSSPLPMVLYCKVSDFYSGQERRGGGKGRQKRGLVRCGVVERTRSIPQSSFRPPEVRISGSGNDGLGCASLCAPPKFRRNEKFYRGKTKTTRSDMTMDDQVVRTHTPFDGECQREGDKAHDMLNSSGRWFKKRTEKKISLQCHHILVHSVLTQVGEKSCRNSHHTE